MSGTFASGTLHKFSVSDLVGDGEVNPGELLLAKQCVIRHSRSTAETFELIAMLGLHQVRETAPEPLPMIAPQLRWRRARHTRGRKS